MAGMPSASVDAIVTDPPYGLGFMGKAWDHGVPIRAFWEEMYRVTKPGGYLLAFGGTRTVHRIATNIEDAGWIIRDMLMWIYASGFPKGKANLKPAHEPIVLARKPGPLRPLGIDECRIPTTAADIEAQKRLVGYKGRPKFSGTAYRVYEGDPAQLDVAADRDPNMGRWPSNVLLSDPELFDEPNPGVVGSGEVTSSGEAHVLRRGGTTGAGMGYGSSAAGNVLDATYGDSGTYARFFLVPKPARSEREPKVRGQLVEAPAGALNMRTDSHSVRNGMNTAARENVHPTVKPLHLMRHLVRLVTPPGGVVLDPFLGSGTTALAAEQEGFRWIGIERETEYVAIAQARLNGTQRGLGL